MSCIGESLNLVCDESHVGIHARKKLKDRHAGECKLNREMQVVCEETKGKYVRELKPGIRGNIREKKF